MTTPAELPVIGLDYLHADYWDLVNARPEYDRAEHFYNGTVDEVYSSPKVARLLSRFGLTELPNFNLTHIAVDAVIETLHVNSVTTEENQLDNLLDELRDSNDLDEEIPELLKNAGKFGDAYLFVWPSADDEGNAVGVRMEQQDPRVTRVFYSEENPNLMVRAIQSWQTGEKDSLVVRANLYFPDHIERWFHKGKVPKNSSRAKWEPFTADGMPASIENPYGRVPYFHFRTERPYGVPLHKNAYGPQVAINKLVTSHLATVDYQSFPQRYALVDPSADLSGSQAGDFDPEHPEDGMSPESPGDSQLDASPNALWNLQGYREVGQFEAANPDAFMKPLEQYKEMMSQATQIPPQAFELDGHNISGEARRVANEPLYNRAESLQRKFGSALRKAYGFALEILGEDTGPVSVNWQPVRNINDYNGWQTLQIKSQMGVPLDVILAEAGYNSADIDQWLSQGASETTSTNNTQDSQVGETEGVDTNGNTDE